MRPRSREGTRAMKVGVERNAVRSRGEGTGLEPVPETELIPAAEKTRSGDAVSGMDALATAGAAGVRYRKVFACSAGESPDEEPLANQSGVTRIGAD